MNQNQRKLFMEVLHLGKYQGRTAIGQYEYGYYLHEGQYFELEWLVVGAGMKPNSVKKISALPAGIKK